MTTLWESVQQLPASDGAALSQPILALLGSTLNSGPTTAAGVIRGNVTLSFTDTFIGVAQLDLGQGMLGDWDFELRKVGSGFVLDLLVDDAKIPLPSAIGPAVDDGAGHLAAAGTPGLVHVVLKTCRLRIDASVAGRQEHLSIVPAVGGGVYEATVDPPDVLLGDTGFGLHLPKLVFDSSATVSSIAALPPEWTGVAVPEAKLFFPAKGPKVIPEPITVEFAISDHGAVYAKGHVHLPKDGSRPDTVVDVTVDDPFGGGLLGLVPTYAKVVLTFEDPVTVPDVGPVATGQLVVSVTWSRLATPPGGAPPAITVTVAAASKAEHGLVELKSGSTSANVAITAAAFAEVVMNGLFAGDGLLGLAALVGAGSLLSGQVDGGSFVLTRAEATVGIGLGAPAPVFEVDYDASVHMKGVGLAGMSIEMDQTPLSLGYRGVKVHKADGLPVALDYSDAKVEVRSTGGWHIHPDVLPLKIPAVRFGQGSLWAEFDIDVALELGPITVDTATVRLHIESGGFGTPELRGLGIHMDLPGVLKVSGKGSLVPDGLGASLAGYAGPGGKGFGVTAEFRHGSTVNGLAVSVSFPGPIPLASSGFGLFGAEGGFAVGAEPQMAAGDPIVAALNWKPTLNTDDLWHEQSGAFTFWLGLMIGTLPDAGFSLNTHARLAVAVPDLLFRLSLDGKLLTLPVSLPAAEGGTAGGAASFLGVFQVGPGGVDVGLRGKVDLLPLLEIDVPVGAHFPSGGDDWFIRLGTDGDPTRPPGPIRISLLPDLFGVDAWAFLMFEGNGISGLANSLVPGNSFPTTYGFTIAFGAGFDLRYGSPPFYIEVSGSFVAEIGTDPFLVAAEASIAGSLHLGPFSLGADAKINFIAGKVRNGASTTDVLWAKGEVCGEIDLWLFSIEGCVAIEFGSNPEPVVDPPNPLLTLSLMRPDAQETPIDRNGGHAHSDTLGDVHTVWPDTIPTLVFSTLPSSVGTTGNVKLGSSSADGATGSDKLKFTYRLASLDLLDQNGAPFVPFTDAGQPTDLLATVQLGKGPGETNEIAINTWASHLWARALEDGGITTGDPAKVWVGQCDRHVDPTGGWTLGDQGSGGPSRWWLPPERWETDPLHSMVMGDASMELVGGKPLDESAFWASETDGGKRCERPRTETFLGLLEPSANLVIPRSFSGCLWMSRTVRPGERANMGLVREGPAFRFRPITPLVPSAVMTPTVCLLVEDALLPPGGEPLFLVESADKEWVLQPVGPHPFEPGVTLVVATWPRKEPVDEVTLRWGIGRLALLGVGGVTSAATASADHRNKANIDRHAAVESAAGPPAAVTGTGRLFHPATEYRVVAQIEATQVLPANSRGVLDLHQGGGSERRFRTAADAPLPADVTDWHYLNDESIFCPEYLRRYLHPDAPFTPPDLARFVFPEDTVRVRFWAEQTEHLAALYGYELHLHIRRVDPHPTGPPPDAIDSALSSIVADAEGAPYFAVDRRVVELSHAQNDAKQAAGERPCVIPIAGTSKTIPAVLSCHGQFELRLVAIKQGHGHERMIKTTTFATSAFVDPHDLLWELGLTDDAQPPGLTTRVTHRGWQDVTRTQAEPGELAVARIALPSSGRGDHQFDDAIHQLGIDPWPVCTSPRRWALWTEGSPAGPWDLHGVLVEAPEPLFRDPRVSLAGPAVAGVPLTSVLVDAAGCRALFLAEPFAPAGRLTVQVTESVGGEAGATPTTTTWTASASVPSQPAIAEEIAVS